MDAPLRVWVRFGTTMGDGLPDWRLAEPEEALLLALEGKVVSHTDCDCIMEKQANPRLRHTPPTCCCGGRSDHKYWFVRGGDYRAPEHYYRD